MAQIKNDRDFAVTVKYTDEEGKEVTKSLEPGASIDVPDNQVEGVKEQIQKAAKPELDDDAADENKDDENKDGKDDENKEDKPDEEGKNDDKPDPDAVAQPNESADVAPDDTNKENEDEDTELSEARKQLAEANAKLAEAEAEKKFNDLLEAGKVLPAHKDKFMELSRTAGSHTVKLSDGKEANVAELVADLFENGPKLVKFGEDGKDEGAGEDRPSSELSEGQREGLKALGLDEEQYDEVMSDKSKE